METVVVPLKERTYSILIGTRILSRCFESIEKHLDRFVHAVVICDCSVRTNIASTIQHHLEQSGIRVSILAIPSGEASKSIDQLQRIWEYLVSERSDHRTVLFAVGGGVIGDLAGFAAASFTRGLRFVQVPTTLLSHVDSSVGGKTGINLPSAKNMVGAFWQPSLVIIDTESLQTLPDREFRSGLAEVVKYGVILDADFFQWIEQNTQPILDRNPTAIAYLIRRCCELKAAVVSNDERETTGLRAILNYGHTFGHAIEAASGFGNYLHGEAISIGMHMAAHLAMSMKRVPSSFVEQQSRLLSAFHLPLQTQGLSPSQLWEIMQSDKKVELGQLSFILPTRMGHVEKVPGITRELAISAMHACGLVDQ